MEKFYIIEWPESQKWSDMWRADNSLNIRLLDDQAVAVECSLYDKEIIVKAVEDEKDLIRDWYLTAYPTDELGKNIDGDATFKDLWKDLNAGKFDCDRYAADDSIVRERVFERLAQKYHVSYNTIYCLWRAA